MPLGWRGWPPALAGTKALNFPPLPIWRLLVADSGRGACGQLVLAFLCKPFQTSETPKIIPRIPEWPLVEEDESMGQVLIRGRGTEEQGESAVDLLQKIIIFLLRFMSTLYG